MPHRSGYYLLAVLARPTRRCRTEYTVGVRVSDWRTRSLSPISHFHLPIPILLHIFALYFPAYPPTPLAPLNHPPFSLTPSLRSAIRSLIPDTPDGTSSKRQRLPSAGGTQGTGGQDQPGGFTYIDKDGEPSRRKIRIEYISDKSRRHITFSKRKAGIMKKVSEFSLSRR